MSRARKFNTYAPGSRGPLEVLVDSTWRRLPKVRNVQFQPQTPSETSIEYVDEPTETRSGQSGPGTATVDITRSPGLLSYRTLDAAFRDGETVLRFRDWGGVPQVEASGAGKTLAITGARGVGVLVGLNAGSASQPAAMFRPGKLDWAGVSFPRPAFNSAKQARPRRGSRTIRSGIPADVRVPPGERRYPCSVE